MGSVAGIVENKMILKKNMSMSFAVRNLSAQLPRLFSDDVALQ